jgi:hypothetical protein
MHERELEGVGRAARDGSSNQHEVTSSKEESEGATAGRAAGSAAGRGGP